MAVIPFRRNDEGALRSSGSAGCCFRSAEARTARQRKPRGRAGQGAGSGPAVSSSPWVLSAGPAGSSSARPFRIAGRARRRFRVAGQWTPRRRLRGGRCRPAVPANLRAEPAGAVAAAFLREYLTVGRIGRRGQGGQPAHRRGVDLRQSVSLPAGITQYADIVSCRLKSVPEGSRSPSSDVLQGRSDA